MATALLADVKPRIIEILNANPGVWSDTVSGDVGAFSHDQEISQAIFEAEEKIAVEGYFQSVNQSLAAPFLTYTPDLVSNQRIPAMRGGYRAVELKEIAGVWRRGIEAKHVDDITNAAAVGTSYVGANSFNFLYKIADGKIYTTSGFARIEYPEYTRTAVLQINRAEEFLLIATTIRLLTKNSSPVPFEYYSGESQRGIQQLISDGMYQQQQQQGVQ